MPRKPTAKQAFIQAQMQRGATKNQAEYRWRIERGIQRGFSRDQARGHPGKNKLSIKQIQERQQAPVPPIPKRETGTATIRAVYYRRDRVGKAAEIDVSKIMTKSQQQKYNKLIKAGKRKAAKVYALSEVYGVPQLAGGLEWIENFPYDDYDWYDIPDYDDTYTAED
jgi:hypothetical protein